MLENKFLILLCKKSKKSSARGWHQQQFADNNILIHNPHNFPSSASNSKPQNTDKDTSQYNKQNALHYQINFHKTNFPKANILFFKQQYFSIDYCYYFIYLLLPTRSHIVLLKEILYRMGKRQIINLGDSGRKIKEEEKEYSPQQIIFVVYEEYLWCWLRIKEKREILCSQKIEGNALQEFNQYQSYELKINLQMNNVSDLSYQQLLHYLENAIQQQLPSKIKNKKGKKGQENQFSGYLDLSLFLAFFELFLGAVFQIIWSMLSQFSCEFLLLFEVLLFQRELATVLGDLFSELIEYMQQEIPIAITATKKIATMMIIV